MGKWTKLNEEVINTRRKTTANKYMKIRRVLSLTAPVEGWGAREPAIAFWGAM